MLGLAAGLIAMLLEMAYTLVGRRDLGAGLLPQRPGPTQASARGYAVRAAWPGG